MATPFLIATRAHLRVVESNRTVYDVFMRDGVIDPDEQRALDMMSLAESATKAAAAALSLAIGLVKGIVTGAYLGRLVDAYTAAIDELPE